MNENLSASIFDLNWDAHVNNGQCGKAPSFIETLTPENVSAIYNQLVEQQRVTGQVTNYDLYTHLKRYLSEAQVRQILYSILWGNLKSATSESLDKKRLPVKVVLDQMTIPELEALVSAGPTAETFARLGLKEPRQQTKVSVCWIRAELAKRGYSFNFMGQDDCGPIFEKVHQPRKVKTRDTFKWNLEEAGHTRISCPCTTKIRVGSKRDHDLWIANDSGVPMAQINVVDRTISLDQVNPGKYQIVCRTHPDHRLTVMTNPRVTNVSVTQVTPEDHVVRWNLIQNWPQSLTVKAGETVRFESTDGLEHSINYATPTYQKLSVAPLAMGSNFSVEHQFDTPGTIYLYDSANPSIMRIKVTVVPAAPSETMTPPSPMTSTSPSPMTSTPAGINQVMTSLNQFFNSLGGGNQAASVSTPVAANGTPLIANGTPLVANGTPLTATPLVANGTPLTATPLVANATPLVANATPLVATPLVANGTPIVRNGTPVAANGTPIVRNGTPVMVNGTPVVANGTPVVPNRTPVVANGTPVAANGTPVFLEIPTVTSLLSQLRGVTSIPIVGGIISSVPSIKVPPVGTTQGSLLTLPLVGGTISGLGSQKPVVLQATQLPIVSQLLGGLPGTPPILSQLLGGLPGTPPVVSQLLGGLPGTPPVVSQLLGGLPVFAAASKKPVFLEIPAVSTLLSQVGGVTNLPLVGGIISTLPMTPPVVSQLQALVAGLPAKLPAPVILQASQLPALSQLLGGLPSTPPVVSQLVGSLGGVPPVVSQLAGGLGLPVFAAASSQPKLGVYQPGDFQLAAALPTLPEGYVYKTKFLRCFRKWVTIDYALKRLHLTCTPHSQDLIHKASPETVNLLAMNPSLADILRSTIDDPYLQAIKEDIGDSLLGRLMTTQNLTTDAAKLEMKALSAWYKFDRKYALKALAQTLSPTGQVNEAELQKLLELRLSKNPKLRRVVARGVAHTLPQTTQPHRPVGEH